MGIDLVENILHKADPPEVMKCFVTTEYGL